MCVRRAVYQQLFPTCQSYTRFSSTVSVHSASQHSTSYGSGNTSSQTVPARCPGATLGCEISSEISDEISREISDEIWCEISRRNFQMAISAFKTRYLENPSGKSVAICGYLFPKPRCRCPNPICCGLSWSSIGAGNLPTQHGWDVANHTDKVAPCLTNGSKT